MEEFLFNYSAGSESPRSRLETSGSLPSAARSGTQVPVTDLLRDYRGNWGFAAPRPRRARLCLFLRAMETGAWRRAPCQRGDGSELSGRHGENVKCPCMRRGGLVLLVFFPSSGGGTGSPVSPGLEGLLDASRCWSGLVSELTG